LTILALAIVVNYDCQSDAPIWSVTSSGVNYDRNKFIIQATDNLLFQWPETLQVLRLYNRYLWIYQIICYFNGQRHNNFLHYIIDIYVFTRLLFQWPETEQFFTLYHRHLWIYQIVISMVRDITIFDIKGAFTLANFACDFALSLHVLLNKNYLFSLLNMQASAKSRAKSHQCKCTLNHRHLWIYQIVISMARDITIFDIKS
jgi:hypothetical protein